MNNLKKVIISFVIVVLCSSISNAIPAGNLSGQKEINKNTAKQAKITNSDSLEKLNALTERYYSNLRTCVPLHFHQYIDFFGFKLGLNVDINGWNNDTCGYRMAVNMDSLGKDIKEVYNLNISDEQLGKIKPVFECNFTQEHLNLMVDAVVARNQRNAEQIREMLKNPNEKYVSHSKSKQQLTKEEEKFVSVLLGSNVCSMPNKDEVTNQITEIMYKL